MYTSNFNSNKVNSKPWAPHPMRPVTHEPMGREDRNKKEFMNAMARKVPGSDNIYGKIPVNTMGYTTNGCPMPTTTGKALLDINTQLSALRSKSEQEVIQMFRQAYAEDPRLAIRWLGKIMDIRGGDGERRITKIILKDMACHGGKNIVNNLIPLIPDFSRWDVLWSLMNTPCQHKVLEVMEVQFCADINKLKEIKNNV